jgi:hypothetical protein
VARRRARDELGEAARRLRAAVAEADAQWRDEASRRFSEQFWDAIDKALRRYEAAAADLEEEVEAIERDER